MSTIIFPLSFKQSLFVSSLPHPQSLTFALTQINLPRIYPVPSQADFSNRASSLWSLLAVNSYRSDCLHLISCCQLFFIHFWLISTYTEIMNCSKAALCLIRLITVSIFLLRDPQPEYIDCLLKRNIATAQSEINWPYNLLPAAAWIPRRNKSQLFQLCWNRWGHGRFLTWRI